MRAVLHKLPSLAIIRNKVTKIRWLILRKCVSVTLTRFWRRSLAAVPGKSFWLSQSFASAAGAADGHGAS
jgi:hypothetical protein